MAIPDTDAPTTLNDTYNDENINIREKSNLYEHTFRICSILCIFINFRQFKQLKVHIYYTANQPTQ